MVGGTNPQAFPQDTHPLVINRSMSTMIWKHFCLRVWNGGGGANTIGMHRPDLHHSIYKTHVGLYCDRQQHSASVVLYISSFGCWALFTDVSFTGWLATCLFEVSTVVHTVYLILKTVLLSAKKTNKQKLCTKKNE